MKVAAKMRKQSNYINKMQLFFFTKNEGDLITKPCSNETEMEDVLHETKSTYNTQNGFAKCRLQILTN